MVSFALEYKHYTLFHLIVKEIPYLLAMKTPMCYTMYQIW